MSSAMSGHPGIQVEVRANGLAIMSLVKDPVNSLDLGMWVGMEKVLDTLEATPSVRGLIITSGLKRDVFSAGNDLSELIAANTTKEKYTKFWIVSNRFLVKLHRSRLVTLAAIRGASPAGGCIIAMCCDHRIMTAAGHIGLNEVMLGIPVPKYWGLLMARLVGHKNAEKVLLTAKLMNPQEAKALGLVDEVVANKEELVAASEKLMAGLIKLPPVSYNLCKGLLRGDFCNDWEAFYATEPISGWDMLNLPAVQSILAAALARLQGANKKPAAKL